jgi:hypothetical protein
MGALLNQSMFLILIGIMKGKTVALIAQDFRNVRPSSHQPTVADAVINIYPGAFRPHLRLVQSLANCQLLQHHIYSRRAPHRLPEFLWSAVEHLPIAGSSSVVDILNSNTSAAAQHAARYVLCNHLSIISRPFLPSIHDRSPILGLILSYMPTMRALLKLHFGYIPPF